MRLKYELHADIERFVDQLKRHLVDEVHATLKDCERYVDARRYCAEEFGKGIPGPNIPGVTIEHLRDHRDLTWIKCEVEQTVLASLKTQCNVEERFVILAAYCALLSRLNGQERLALIFADNRSEGLNIVPLILRPAWNSSFKEFVQQVKQKSLLALANEKYVFPILSRQLSGLDDSDSSFDLAYVSGAPFNGESGVALIERALEPYPIFNGGIGLALEIEANGKVPEVRLTFDQAKLAPPAVEIIAQHLKCFMEAVAADSDINVGDIALDGNDSSSDVPLSLTEEVFDF